MGHLEQANRCSSAPGERALAMAEQFDFEERLGPNSSMKAIYARDVQVLGVVTGVIRTVG